MRKLNISLLVILLLALSTPVFAGDSGFGYVRMFNGFNSGQVLGSLLNSNRNNNNVFCMCTVGSAVQCQQWTCTQMNQYRSQYSNNYQSPTDAFLSTLPNIYYDFWRSVW